MAEAKNYGIRLLLSLTNGDTGFGGMEQYVKWSRGGAKGGSITDFLTSAEIRVSKVVHTRQSTRPLCYWTSE